MRAWVVERTGPIDGGAVVRRVDRDVPRPAPGEALVRVLACGVCRTDLHAVEGDLDLPALPLVPGHQAVGEVVEAPAGSGLAAGDRVGIPWLRWTCGRCRFCRSGRENLCPDARFTGFHADGGYADYATVPAAFALPLPAALAPVDAAPLLCAGVIGFRALRLSGIRPGGRLGLYGFGAAAHLAVQVASHWGCETFVFTRSGEHAALARSLGAAWAGRSDETPPAPLDAAVVFAPAGAVVPHALRALDRGGTVAIAGIHMTPIPSLDYDRDLFLERVLRSVTANTREDAREFLRLAAEIPVRTAVERVPFDRAREALVRLARGEVQGAAVLEM
ncbi:MAG TPA: zinc-dependent alcohol dehydrogenase family protein [Thermodesulfobacteriota bacterium]